MASSAQIKALLQSYLDRNDTRFCAIALQVAAAEARKGHVAFAKEIKELVDKSRKNQSFVNRPGLLHIAQPQGEAADLLSVQYPSSRLSDMILDSASAAHIRRVLTEQ